MRLDGFPDGVVVTGMVTGGVVVVGEFGSVLGLSLVRVFGFGCCLQVHRRSVSSGPSSLL